MNFCVDSALIVVGVSGDNSCHQACRHAGRYSRMILLAGDSRVREFLCEFPWEFPRGFLREYPGPSGVQVLVPAQVSCVNACLSPVCSLFIVGASFAGEFLCGFCVDCCWRLWG